MTNKSIENMLYWIGTPRHFLIAAGMASRGSEQCDSDLLLTSQQGYVSGIMDVLDSWSGNPFSHMRLVQIPRTKNPLSRRLRLTKDISRYRRVARTQEFTEIRAFVATTYEAQAFLYEVRKRFPNTKRVMIEDGGIFYNTQFIGGDTAKKGYSRLKLLAGRAFYGAAWAAVKKNGIGEVIDEIHLIAPKLVRREWLSHNLVELSPDHLHQLAKTDLPEIYLQIAGCSIEELTDIECFVILSRSDGVASDLVKYVDTVNELLGMAKDQGLKIGAKYHPKEQERDYMMLGEKSWIVEMPRELPSELLFIVNSTNLQYVLGDTSTALLSGPWLLPKCAIISFADLVSKHSELIYPDFGGFGIDLISSASDFAERLIND